MSDKRINNGRRVWTKPQEADLLKRLEEHQTYSRIAREMSVSHGRRITRCSVCSKVYCMGLSKPKRKKPSLRKYGEVRHGL